MQIFSVTIHFFFFFAELDKSLECLTNQNRENYELSQIIKIWHHTYEERASLLSQLLKKKNTLTIEKYYSSFPFLSSPHAITLVSLDFYVTNK